MDIFSTINGKILIPPRNKMTGKVKIIGSGSVSLPSTLIVTHYSNLTGAITVYSDEVIINPAYPPLRGNQRKSSIDVLYRSNLQARIAVTPRNKMTGKVSVIEPPTYTMELPSVKDAFVRSSIPTLNYGTEEIIAVGHYAITNDAFRALIEFDTSQIPENAKIQSASLKLYNNKQNLGTHQVGVYTASSTWLEHGVTWVNQPAVKDIITIANLGQTGYTDIDVTTIVLNWYDGNETNHGFILKALNESQFQMEEFSTRESSRNKPVLEVSYKLDIIYSLGINDINSSLFVMAVDHSNLVGKITIPQFDSDRNLSSRIHVRNFNYWLEANIWVDKPDMPSRINIRRTDRNNIPASVRVRVKGGHLPQDRLQCNLTVNAKVRLGKITIPHRSQITSDINVRRYVTGFNTLNSTLFVIRKLLTATMEVRQNGAVNLTGAVRVRIYKMLPANLFISNPDLVSTITITTFDSLASRISVSQLEKLTSTILIPHRRNIQGRVNVIHASHLPASIQVLSGYLRSKIKIPAHGENSLLSRITVRVKGISEINSSITVGGDNIPGGYIYIL